MLKGFLIRELQADEIRTFIGAKKRVSWVLTSLEVWSRLWVSFEIGGRNFRNIKRVIRQALQRGRVEHRFLFSSDGFEMYEWAAKRLLSGVCIYGQVIKKRRENRVVRVDRRVLLGTQAELEEALFSFRGFQHSQHEFHRAPQSDHPPGLFLSGPSHPLPRPPHGILGRSGGFTHGLLQFSATAQGFEVWQDATNSSHASWTG